MKTVAQCQHWLAQNINAFQGKATIEKFSKKINKIRWLSETYKVILVSGTNGKGSTCLLLENILCAAGYRVGCFTSPHLLQINERIRIDGRPVDETLFCEFFNKVKAVYPPSEIFWFEFLSLVGLNIFAQQPLDFLILECGKGGRFDIMNAIEPDISVITTVALDHTDVLGETREEIGWQKAGIFRRHKPAICGDPEPPSSVLDYSKEIQANLSIQGQTFTYQLEGKTWSWLGVNQKFNQLPIPAIALQNASTVLAIVNILAKNFTISETAIRQGLSSIFVPGRMQKIATDPTIICDVAHNPQSVTYLANELAKQTIQGKNLVLVAMRDDKNIVQTLAAMSLPVSDWFLTNLPNELTFVSQAQAYLQKNVDGAVHIDDSVTKAFENIQAKATENDRIIIFGSFQTVGMILRDI